MCGVGPDHPYTSILNAAPNELPHSLRELSITNVPCNKSYLNWIHAFPQSLPLEDLELQCIPPPEDWKLVRYRAVTIPPSLPITVRKLKARIFNWSPENFLNVPRRVYKLRLTSDTVALAPLDTSRLDLLPKTIMKLGLPSCARVRKEEEFTKRSLPAPIGWQ